MDTILQLIVILAIFSIAVVNAIKKDKQKKLEEAGESLDQEIDTPLDEWFDEAVPVTEEKSSEKKRPLQQVHAFTEGLSADFEEGIKVTHGRHLTEDEEKMEVEPIVDLSSQEEIRKGIIWSEILQRKYF